MVLASVEGLLNLVIISVYFHLKASCPGHLSDTATPVSMDLNTHNYRVFTVKRDQRLVTSTVQHGNEAEMDNFKTIVAFAI